MNLSFKIPASAKNGATRMRIQMNNSSHNTNSCAAFSKGEVEDYTAIIWGNSHIVKRETEGISDENSIDEFALSVYPNPAKLIHSL